MQPFQKSIGRFETLKAVKVIVPVEAVDRNQWFESRKVLDPSRMSFSKRRGQIPLDRLA